MNYHSTSHTYTRPVEKFGLRQFLRPYDLFDFSRDIVLLRMVGKALLMILPLILAVHLILGSMIAGHDTTIAGLDNRRHQLVDENIGLLAQKASVFSPDSIEQLAAEKLELFVASKERVGKFSRRHGTFRYN